MRAKLMPAVIPSAARDLQIVLLMLLLASSAGAQVPVEILRPGARLRVIAMDSAASAEGRLLSLAHDTLWLRRPHEHDTLRYLSPMIRAVQVASGISSSEAAVKGAALGFVGVLVAGSIHPRTGNPCPVATLDCPAHKSRAWVIPAATFAGAVIGGALGNEHWADVRWPPGADWEPESPERSLTHGRHVAIRTTRGTSLKARVLERRGDSLYLAGPDPFVDSLRYATSDIESIAVATGVSSSYREFYGAVIGLGVGVAASYFAASLHSCRGCDSVARERAVWLVPLGTLAGALLGKRSGDERWTRIRWP
ncbi:MAG TPA: hypothetical protein VJ867_06865 [Gemmatimonadaceae bacterium]|nr:hypothetical protein [Gemmatimonadaceae bacterium]